MLIMKNPLFTILDFPNGSTREGNNHREKTGEHQFTPEQENLHDKLRINNAFQHHNISVQFCRYSSEGFYIAHLCLFWKNVYSLHLH
eukprot:maker-scaffold_31-snap-gene-0.48-mRNA-1 protein AED:0.45 eAED:0.84 QI:45/0/0.33/1/0/0/3/0/86